MNLTISLRKFLETVSSASGLSYETCESLNNEFTTFIASQLSNGESVTVKGIGTFRLIDEDVVFAPDPELAEKINMPFAAFEAVELPDEVTDEMLENSIGSPTTGQEEAVEPKPEISPETDTSIAPPPFFPPIPDVKGQQPEDAAIESVESPIVPPLPPVEENSEPENDEDTDEDSEATVTQSANNLSWKLAIAAFIAGVVCFTTGYFMGRWVSAPESESDAEEPATETTERTETATVSEVAEEISASDTIEATVITETPPAKDLNSQPTITDRIGRNRFLTTMSRQYYGRMEFWVYIYEENASKLGNPNKLEAGTVVVIPPAEKYGIDASDPESIARAEAKAKEITAKFAR